MQTESSAGRALKDLVLPKLPDLNYLRQSIEDRGGIDESDLHFTEGKTGAQRSYVASIWSVTWWLGPGLQTPIQHSAYTL